MRTKNLIVTTVVFVFSVMGVYAQRVETALVDGLPVINCSGMSEGAISPVSKGNTEALLGSKGGNEVVYSRFAVDRTDSSSSHTWSNAFTACSNKGAGWRLPTQRELMLMYVLKAELEKTSGFTPFLTYYNTYWSATSYVGNDIISWTMSFRDGFAQYNGNFKYDNHSVRCLKEL